MNTPRVSAIAISLMLAPAALAVTDFWDGGGTTDNFNNGDNWVDNTAPASDLLATDLVFAGVIRPTPFVSLPFSARSIVFNNTAGAFSVSGAQLNLGAGGITNQDSQIMTFTNPLSFAGTTNATISGGLVFTNAVALPTGTLTLNDLGNTTSFGAISGAGFFRKLGAGTMTWTTNAVTAFDIEVANGTLALGVDGSTNVFSNTSSIAISLSGTFRVSESVTLDGAQLTDSNDPGGGLTIDPGKTLTVQTGGDVLLDDTFGLSAATVTVTGAGSTFSTTDEFQLTSGAALNVSSGGSVSSGSERLRITDSTVAVTSAGSSLAGGTLDLHGTGALAFSLASTGTFDIANVNAGTLNVGSAASLTVDELNIGASGPASVTVTGTGSALTALGGGFTNTIGAATGSTSTLNIQSSGTFNSGAAGTYVEATGVVAIAGGTFNATGDVIVNGGQLTRDAAGVLALAPGKDLQVSAGGDAIFTEAFNVSNASTISIAGTGSTFSTIGGALTINGGSVFLVHSAGSATAGGNVSIGATGGYGVATITGTSSAFTTGGAATLTIGSNSGAPSNLNVQSNGVFHSGTGLSAVRSTGTIAITGGTYHSHGNLLLNGGQLTRDAAGTFQLDAGQTLAVEAGGDAIFTGSYTHPTASTIEVIGTGSTFSATGSLKMPVGSTMVVESGGVVSVGGNATITASLNLADQGRFTASGSGLFHLGSLGGNGTATVVDPGSRLSGGTLNLGAGFTGNLTFGNGGAGEFGTLGVADSSLSGSIGNLTIQGGASVIGTGLQVASKTGSAVGTVNITGAGSKLTVTGSGITIGAASGSSGVVNIASGGIFTTGTGLTEIRATGDLNINAGGTMIVRGNMTVATSLDIAGGGKVILNSAALPPAPAFDGEFSGDEILNIHAPAAAIPEPGTGALIFSALGLLGMRGRRIRFGGSV